MKAPPSSLSPLQMAAAAMVIRVIEALERAGMATHFTISVRVQGRQVSAKVEAVPMGSEMIDRSEKDD